MEGAMKPTLLVFFLLILAGISYSQEPGLGSREWLTQQMERADEMDREIAEAKRKLVELYENRVRALEEKARSGPQIGLDYMGAELSAFSYRQRLESLELQAILNGLRRNEALLQRIITLLEEERKERE